MIFLHLFLRFLFNLKRLKNRSVKIEYTGSFLFLILRDRNARAVKGDGLKIRCVKLRGFKSHFRYILSPLETKYDEFNDQTVIRYKPK